jgi:hypothetical protein
MVVGMVVADASRVICIDARNPDEAFSGRIPYSNCLSGEMNAREI